MDHTDNRPSLYLRLFVWIFRILVGATFVISGWSKSVDPWGFIYKLEEYFNVWGLALPREITLSFAISLSVSEFVVGVLLMVGAMRRATVWLSAAFMVVMLPLTAYIAVADPVSDCGCFGDFIILSNYLTLAKNIVLSAMLIYLLINNDRVSGLYALSTQWLVVAGAIAYAGALALIGYRYQPLVDFRPYPVGYNLSAIAADDSDNTDDGVFIYSKNGEEKAFGLDALPDSTWTFVRAEMPDDSHSHGTLTVYDDGDDVTDEVLDGDGDMIILAVIDPSIHYLTRARLANELYDYISLNDKGRMVAFVAAEDDDLEAWRQLALPRYPVYSVEDTSLKELVRGDAGIIWLHNGIIEWKRNLASVSHDALRSASGGGKVFLSREYISGDLTFHTWLTLALLVWLIVVYSLNFPNKILNGYFRRRSLKNS